MKYRDSMGAFYYVSVSGVGSGCLHACLFDHSRSDQRTGVQFEEAIGNDGFSSIQAACDFALAVYRRAESDSAIFGHVLVINNVHKFPVLVCANRAFWDDDARALIGVCHAQGGKHAGQKHTVIIGEAGAFMVPLCSVDLCYQHRCG